KGAAVDTNYHRAVPWYRACRKSGVTPEIWRIQRRIGMGGDQLVAAIAGEEVEERVGDDIREAEGEIYMSLIDEIEAFEGATELIAELAELADAVILASSAKEHEV